MIPSFGGEPEGIPLPVSAFQAANINGSRTGLAQDGFGILYCVQQFSFQHSGQFVHIDLAGVLQFDGPVASQLVPLGPFQELCPRVGRVRRLKQLRRSGSLDVILGMALSPPFCPRIALRFPDSQGSLDPLVGSAPPVGSGTDICPRKDNQ
jgi:hypothetical protein